MLLCNFLCLTVKLETMNWSITFITSLPHPSLHCSLFASLTIRSSSWPTFKSPNSAISGNNMTHCFYTFIIHLNSWLSCSPLPIPFYFIIASYSTLTISVSSTKSLSPCALPFLPQRSLSNYCGPNLPAFSHSLP